MTKVLDIQEKLADRKRLRDLLAIMGRIDDIEKDLDLNPRKYIERAHNEIVRLHQLIDDIRRVVFQANRIQMINDPVATMEPEHFRLRRSLITLEKLLEQK